MSKSFADDVMRDFNEYILPQEISEIYDVLECLAQNEYGETYLLTNNNDGKLYVLKCYKKTDDVCNVQEAKLLRGLSHKGIPTFTMETEDEGTIFVIREYAEGTPLNDYLMENQIEEPKAVEILIELCDILTYLHSQPNPIIHRDIKPSNIIINPYSNEIKLIDFGISRAYSEEAETDTFFFGTQKFAPPEQYGFAQTDCRADIYALGVVLRYMMTGTADLKTDIQNKTLRHIATKCCAFSPNSRYQSADAVKRALKRYEKNTKKKVLISIASICGVCLVFVVGFAVGRYTDIFNNQKPDALDVQDSVESEYVTFVEPLIEKAAHLMLGLDAEEPITYTQLKSIKSIFILGEEAVRTQGEWDTLHGEFLFGISNYGDLESLEDLKYMENLQNITIMAENLSDISGIANNTRLEGICIMHCNVKDISPLKDLFRLGNCLLFDNLIDDFSVFESMTWLESLSIGKNSSLKQFSELGEMSNIKELSFHQGKISSLDGVEKCLRLESLDLTNTDIHDFSALNDLPCLEILRISTDMEKFLPTLSRDDLNVIISDY